VPQPQHPDRQVVAPHSQAKALWDAGVALYGLTEEAVSVVVPPLGGTDG
jgi:hypothetical protein